MVDDKKQVPERAKSNRYKLEVEFTVEKVEKIKKNLFLKKETIEKLQECSKITGESASRLIDKAIKAMKITRS